MPLLYRNYHPSLLVDEADLADREHVDSSRSGEDLTLSAYLAKIYGITRVLQAQVLMVNAKRVEATLHL